ncbi:MULTISPECIES: IclR family transcriptional regulator [Actinosynnema]|uniref:IclR family transcriptional regulator n=1 Tax=Actinosynnema pretiosum TaxID=42197 RepID=A0A290ZCY2_9PSEU|nr:IclR family transcriptional regulator [Actinosynnema pretiosum]ATE56857.1 IclR family transcriptional regulator [Actinosynnema pretiosum]
MEGACPKVSRESGGVQSLQRAFDLLERLADAGGEASLSELASASGLPLPTIHRLIRTLVDLGYVRQHDNRRYALGPRLIRLGEGAGRQFGTWARPLLAELVDETGETANLAVLDGDEIVYVAQAPSRHSMRMFTEVGRRVLPHATGVGKAVLAALPRDRARELLERTGLPARTPNTITDLGAMLAELDLVAARGHALDEGEQELGVRCVAVVVPGGPTPAAVSVSGPEGRLTREAAEGITGLLHGIADRLASRPTMG